jgi:hypothetical protein
MLVWQAERTDKPHELVDGRMVKPEGILVLTQAVKMIDVTIISSQCVKNDTLDPSTPSGSIPI